MKTKKLTDRQLVLLLLIGDEYMTGREVARTYRRLTGRTICYGVLYVAFRRLADLGLVRVHDSEDDDGRVRSFCLTATGLTFLDRPW